MPLALLIPVYEDCQGLQLSLDSLAHARIPCATTVIVVDDGSDPPITVDSKRSQKFRLHVHRLPANQGIESALNQGLEIIKLLGFDYVARLDAGDQIFSERLSMQYNFLEKHEDVVVVGSDVEFVDENGNQLFVYVSPTLDDHIRRRMHVSCSLMHPAVMMRMSAIRTIGNYSSHYPAAEDYDFFFRLLAVGQAASLPDVLTTKVIDEKSISIARRRRQLISRLRIQIKYFDPTTVESYIGILATALLMGIPGRLIERAKRFLGTVPC